MRVAQVASPGRRKAREVARGRILKPHILVSDEGMMFSANGWGRRILPKSIGPRAP